VNDTNGRGNSVRRRVEVLNIKANTRHIVRLLGPIEGMLTHWRSGKSTPCPGVGKCLSHEREQSTIWKGYAPAEEWFDELQAWLACVLEVTECLEEEMRDRQLRGQIWCLTRPQDDKKSAPVQGFFMEQSEENELGLAVDIVPVLERLYHGKPMQLGVANPIVAKQIREGNTSAGPKCLVALQSNGPTSEPITHAEMEKKMIAAGYFKDSKGKWCYGRK